MDEVIICPDLFQKLGCLFAMLVRVHLPVNVMKEPHKAPILRILTIFDGTFLHYCLN